MRHVLYGRCVRCGRTYEAVPDLVNCACGGILDIVYDYDYIKTVLTKETLRGWVAINAKRPGKGITAEQYEEITKEPYTAEEEPNG